MHIELKPRLVLWWGAGLTEGEKEEGAKAKEALNSDGEGSDDEGDTRKAATYGNKKTEVRLAIGCTCVSCMAALGPKTKGR